MPRTFSIASLAQRLVAPLRVLWRRRWWLVAAALATAVWLRIGPPPARLLDESAHPATLLLDRDRAGLYGTRTGARPRAARLSAWAR
mgnify:CR=1 FL=1